MNNLQRNRQLQGLDKKNKRRKPTGLRQFLTLYIHYINLEGQMGHLPRLYLPNKTNSLREKGCDQGLDRFLEMPSCQTAK
jgi:hypothetical protein